MRTIAIDFFCGAGGMTNGLISAGVAVLAGVDNEQMCRETYSQNRNQDGSAPEFLCKNIFPKSAAYPGGQQAEIGQCIEGFVANYKRKHGLRKINLVFAICAPCQPFTRITKIEMSQERRFKRQNDKNLLLTTLNLIRAFKPTAVICENVEGLGSGEDSVLQEFKRKLVRLGYQFESSVINAARFGVPQNRRRTIGVGVLATAAKNDVEIPESDASLTKVMTVREAIGHLPVLAAGEASRTLKNHRARGLTELNLKRISCAPPGASNAYLRTTPYGDLGLECHRRIEKKSGRTSFSDTYTRMHPDHVAPTITTKCMSLSNGRFGHYDTTQNRAITPREAATLQTFPESYVFYPEESLDFPSLLIGNAVPPRLAQFFGNYIRTLIE